MPTTSDSIVEALAGQIEHYLAAHPDASDTADGIRSGWLGGASQRVSAQDVDRALASLLARHVLAKQVLPDGKVRFARPQLEGSVPSTRAQPAGNVGSARTQPAGGVRIGYPGVYVEEVTGAVHAIEGVSTSVAAFAGLAASGPMNEPVSVKGLTDYERSFGGLDRGSALGYAVRDYFANGGREAIVVRVSASTDDAFIGDRTHRTGLHALDAPTAFNLLCVPPARLGGATSAAVYREALALCVARRALLIVDPDPAWAATRTAAAQQAIDGMLGLGLSGEAARNAALYFPCVREADPLGGSTPGAFAPCGAVAGLIARTDATRGVWKAPAGTEGSLAGTLGLQVDLTDADASRLNASGINCLRAFPGKGTLVWGARTLRSADAAHDDYAYVPVRRLGLFIEESVSRGTQWVASEQNAEPAWAAIRVAVGAFLDTLFRQGAFPGRTAKEAWWVRCDATTMTQDDIDRGIVNIVIGFAPLKPAEFVIVRIQQLAAKP